MKGQKLESFIMKVLICNTLEKRGGAARSAYRIYEAIKNQGVDITYHYLFKDKQETKSLIPKIDAIPRLLFARNRKVPFSTSIFSFGGKRKIKKFNPDILHLNYINMGMLSIREIGSFDIPVVWTLHDSWAFTGGCHLPTECDLYENDCGNCPSLQSKNTLDLSSFILKQKKKYWKNKNIHIVCPSKWIMSKAEKSPLFKKENIHLIPNPLNTEVFRHFNKEISRKKYDLDINKKYILFGSINPFRDKNKGFHLLADALRKIKTENVELLVFGSETKTPDTYKDIPIRNIGFIENGNDLAYLYSAADITVITSISENLPNILLESLSCGTPCIGFNVGGIPEIINKELLGETVKPYDTEELARKMDSLINSDYRDNREEIHKNIKDRYDYEVISKQYIELYKSLTL